MEITMTIPCKLCGLPTEFYPSWAKRGRGQFCTKDCYALWMSINKRGTSHPQFLPNTTNYSSVHNWLRNTYGKATKCELPSEDHSSTYEWALLKGKKHARKRENYIQACESCHRKYDVTEEIKQKIRVKKTDNPTRYWLGKKRNMPRNERGQFLHTA